MQSPLSAAETATLRCLVGALIPASAEYGVPGADDEVIFASLLASLGRDTAEVQQALAAMPLPPHATPACADLVAAFNAQPGAATLHRVLLLCYYRDDRVMHALGQEARPPFPRGFTLEQGDWSLLDPVRARPKLWRDPGKNHPSETP